MRVLNHWSPAKENALPAFCGKTIVLLLFPVLLWSQNISVSGTVTSAADGLPLIGVNILEKGTQNGTTTDLDGQYKLNVPGTATLVFSYIGFEAKEIAVKGQTNIDIVLEEEAEMLEDIVVTGYRKEIRSNVSSAISTVKPKDIEKLSVVGLDQALQGQVAGLQVTQTTGAPGDDIAVRMRGVSTLGNNNPLYIIDGVPTTGPVNMFSLNDVESIQVLKDGAAAAIYGSRAANGVIIITTKKGKSGEPVFSFQSYYGVQQPANLPELLNAKEYLTIRNEAIQNANTLRDPRRQLETYPESILDTLPDNNWLDLLFGPAPMQRYSLSATGGAANSTYYVMGEYLSQDGIFRGQGFDKYLVRFNGEIGKGKFKVGNNFAFSYTDRKVINSSGDGAGPGNELSGIRYTLIAAPVFPIYDKQGHYVNTSNVLGDPSLYGDGNANPLAFVDATDWTIRHHRAFGNVFAELTPIPDLSIRTNLGIDLLFENNKLFKQRLSAAIYDPSSLSEGRTISQNLVWNNTVNYQHAFGTDGNHQTSFLVGMEAIDNRANFLGASANNFIRTDPLFRYINNSVTQDISNIGASGIETAWGLLSYFAQANYNFRNRYIIQGAVRRDGSSRFGSENRWGTFPSVSVAWNIANEDFLQNVKALSSLKLRASWGQLGNQEIGIYPYSSLVQTGQFVYPFGGQIVTGATIVETGNQNIRWETTTQKNVGLDVSFWNDKLSVVADYYIKNSSDILVRIPIPQIAGSVNPPYVNAGKVQNKGLEIAASLRNHWGDLQYSITANASTVSNKVVSLAGSEPILGGFGLSDGPITKTEPGYPIGSFFLYEAIGLFQSQEEIEASPFQTADTRPGDVKFADLNGDNVIDDKDRAHFGSPFPDLVYGLTLNLNYKNFDFSTLLQGVQGNDVYFLYGNFAYETQSRGFNSYREILNRWTPDHTNTDIPKVSYDDRNGNRRISTRFLENGSYLRFRNITLGYNLRHLLPKDWVQNLRIYTTIQNALTFTKYPGLDPEIQANSNDTQGFGVSSDLAVGIDWGTVPAPRIFMLGLDLDF
ncbi:MAG: TonB-dependent receptor [Saprospiraceae bacterium]